MQRISWRAVFLGLLLIVPSVIWIVWMERVMNGPFSTTASLFFTATITLVIVVVLNGLWKRISPRTALSQGEMLTAYSLLGIGTAMAAVDFLSPLMTLMAHPARYATADNGWDRFLPFLPSWLIVTDKDTLKGYFEGHSTPYTWAVLKAWGAPLAAWTGFILVLIWVMACLNTMVRAQWSEKERLTFPLIHLPLALTDPNGALVKKRLFWLGVAITATLSCLNEGNLLNPNIPAVTFNGFNIMQWFQQPPWNVMGSGGWMPIAVFPFMVGLGFLLPTDLLFSCWFFYIFSQLEKVAFAAGGIVNDKTRYPYLDEQAWGGYMSVLFFALLTARSHLRDVWNRAWQKGADETPDTEPMTYRTAVFGALAGFAVLVVFGWMAGLPPLIAVLFFTLYFLVALAVSRMRAELGPPTHDLHGIGPNAITFSVFGTTGLDRQTMTTLTLFYWFNRAYRAHPAAHEIEGYQMMKQSGLSPRGLPVAHLAAALVGIVTFAVTNLHASYHLGAAARMTGWASLGAGNEAFEKLSSWFGTPTPPDFRAMGGMVVGFAFASALTLIRKSVYGFPFHALGFAVSGGWSMMWAWASLFVAWTAKVIITRYGGLPAYRNALPFFFGIIIGDIGMGAIWALLGTIIDIPVYSVWSG